MPPSSTSTASCSGSRSRGTAASRSTRRGTRSWSRSAARRRPRRRPSTAQRALAAAEWPDKSRVLVRMGLHTGEPERGPEGYVGIDVVRAARIQAVAHGGQVLVSQLTRDLLADAGYETARSGKAPPQGHPGAGAPLPARRRRPGSVVPAAAGRSAERRCLRCIIDSSAVRTTWRRSRRCSAAPTCGS